MEPGSFLRLSELNGKVKKAIEGAFHTLNFWVVADVTSHFQGGQELSFI